MLDTLAQYVYKVYRLKSVSAAAKALYISQPALSAAIRKAETALGAPIFNRKTLPFTLTAEGKVYIEGIERVLEVQKQTAEKLRDMHAMRGGTLRVGTAAHLSLFVLPKILDVLHREYPQIDIQIEVADYDKLSSLLDNDTVDILLLPTNTGRDGYTAVPLFKRRFVVAMMPTVPGCDALKQWAVTYDQLINHDYGEDKLIADMSVFHDFEFVYNPPQTSIYKKRKILFGNADTPSIVSNSGKLQLNYNLMLAGFGALLTTDADMATMPASSCLFFVLDGAEAVEDFCVLRPTEHNALTPVIDRFTDIAKSLFEHAPLSSLR